MDTKVLVGASEYQDMNRINADCKLLAELYKTLMCTFITDKTLDGSSIMMLTVRGTIPVPYKDQTYNLPIIIGLPTNYPDERPMVSLDPTEDMVIRTSEYVDEEGLVLVPYMEQWQPSSKLHLLVTDLIVCFSKAPPLFRRRSQPLHQQRNSTGLRIEDTKGKSSSLFPSTWTAMKDDLLKLVPINSGQSEYVQVLEMIQKTLAINVIKMVRIQNPYLYRAYVNRKEYLKRKSNGRKAYEEYLFHGTNSKHIDVICEENLDWRLHGSNVGQKFGRGTYFTNCASLATHYSSGTPKCLFVVKVFVGLTAQGDSSMVKPPGDCDTTVDLVAYPKIFVKYDAQEYYPEYYVQYTQNTAGPNDNLENNSTELIN